LSILTGSINQSKILRVKGSAENSTYIGMNSVSEKFRYIKSRMISCRHACKAISGLITTNISARVPLW